MLSRVVTRLKERMSRRDGELPIPPLELRRLVGPTDPRDYDNPDGRLLWGDLVYGPLKPGEAYQRIFDFGCGCGRQARQFMLQSQSPERLVGVDVNRVMIEWCQKNLARPGVEFYHHDVSVHSPNPTYAPGNAPNEQLPLRQHGQDFTLINATSVFTHLLEKQTRFYLQELTAMLAENGLLRTSWFFFNRDWFPVLTPQQHCLYVNEKELIQAIYYDWSFFKQLVRENGLKIIDVAWTRLPGYQSAILLARGKDFTDKTEQVKPAGTVLGFGSSAPSPDVVFDDNPVLF